MFVPPGIVKVTTFSYAHGLNYIQKNNFTITESHAPIKSVILRHPVSVKLIFDARFGFYVENYNSFARKYRFFAKEIWGIAEIDEFVERFALEVNEFSLACSPWRIIFSVDRILKVKDFLWLLYHYNTSGHHLSRWLRCFYHFLIFSRRPV